MTFREFAIRELVDNGMFPNQAEAVLKTLTDQEDHPMRERWNHEMTEYPPVMKQVVLLTIRGAAITWIDANIPQAWFRPMFAEGATQ